MEVFKSNTTVQKESYPGKIIDIKEDEMHQVFNMGIGMTIVCSPHEVAKIVSILPQAKVIGEIIKKGEEERVIIN